jgi:hypothetical protein
MESARPADSIGDALQACLSDAKRAWLRKNQVGRPAESAWTSDTVTTHLDAQFSHSKLISAQVTIVCKQPWKSEVFFFKLQRATKGGVKRIGDTLDLKVS